MSIDEIRGAILEDASEDAYGDWEIWWGISGKLDTDTKEKMLPLFVQVMAQLVAENMISFMEHKSDGPYVPAIFSAERLEAELRHADNPDPDAFYWIEATQLGKNEDIKLRAPKI